MNTLPRVLVTGPTGFLGYRVMSALLAAGAQVTALVHPDRQDLLQPIADRINVSPADVWNKASLKGRARNHQAIIHLVGSTRADPLQGLTYNQLNLVPARNIINMAVSDGVPYVILLSTVVRPLELSGEYVRNKRDAEIYLHNSGVGWIVVRAGSLFPPHGHPFLRLAGFLGRIFPINITMGRYLPLSADVAARGFAGLALNPMPYQGRTLYTFHLRRVASKYRFKQPLMHPPSVSGRDTALDPLDEAPFGWLPPYR